VRVGGQGGVDCADNGLIFYNGHSDEINGDFISLALNNGLLELRWVGGMGFVHSMHPQYTHMSWEKEHNIEQYDCDTDECAE
jgi:hypothetical protein